MAADPDRARPRRSSLRSPGPGERRDAAAARDPRRHGAARRHLPQRRPRRGRIPRRQGQAVAASGRGAVVSGLPRHGGHLLRSRTRLLARLLRRREARGLAHSHDPRRRQSAPPEQRPTARSQETDHDRRPIRQLHPRPDRRRDRRRDRRLAAPLALPAQLEGALVRAHRPRRAEGGARRRRLRAADRPRRDPGEHEHPAPRGDARPRQGADHPRPDAGRPDGRVLRPRRGASPRRWRRRRRRWACAPWSRSS